MSRKIWDAALKLVSAEYGDENISIGGGEPTLHPQFWNYLIDAIATFDYVWLATNGSQTDTALKLAKLAAKGVIGCALSQDEYHDPIDPKVVAAFWEGQRKNDAKRFSYGSDEKPDGREIRNVTRDPSHLSPFRDPEDGGDSENCPCDTVIIKPDGKIRFCG
jgi:organic radical activating enzyme